MSYAQPLTGLSTIGDNYTALQAAINKGGFSLSPGVYPCSKSLVLPANGAVLQGNGSYSSVIKMTTPGVSALVGVDVARVTLSGIGLTGTGVPKPGAVVTPPIANGISLSRKSAANTYGLSFDDVCIQQFTGSGIDAAEANIIVSRFTRVTCEVLSENGFYISGAEGGASGTSLSLEACYANACGEAGYYLENMTYVSLNACACDASATGYVLSECQGVSLTACGTEDIGGSGNAMYNDGTSFRVDGCNGVDFGSSCWTYQNGHYVLHVSGSSSNIRAGRIGENSPLPSALGHTLVDSGSQFN
jgi:hypothetical protein